jgi:cellulose synthase/poly-beta-1,6-N-acetylglucosamine synthase-like glycosyltransferase
VTDQDCVVPEDWIARLEAHFSNPDVNAVGGSVGVRDRSNWSGLALYFLEFLTHFPRRGRASRNTNFVIGCNGAYRAEALRCVAYPDRTLGEDVLFSRALRKRGFTVVYDPTIEVEHQNRAGWDEFFSYNREMGRKAAQCQQLLGRWWATPFLRVPALAFLAPAAILPAVAGRLARSRRMDFLRFLLLSPLCLAGNLMWAGAFRRQVLEERRQARKRVPHLRPRPADSSPSRRVG